MNTRTNSKPVRILANNTKYFIRKNVGYHAQTIVYAKIGKEYLPVLTSPVKTMSIKKGIVAFWQKHGI